MNIAKIYTDITKLPKESGSGEQKSVSESNEDAARAQAKFNWKSSTVTQEVVASIHKEINDLIVKSVGLAVSYPTHTNAHQIVQNLIRVDTLTKLLQNYVE